MKPVLATTVLKLFYISDLFLQLNNTDYFFSIWDNDTRVLWWHMESLSHKFTVTNIKMFQIKTSISINSHNF